MYGEGGVPYHTAVLNYTSDKGCIDCQQILRFHPDILQLGEEGYRGVHLLAYLHGAQLPVHGVS